VPVAALSASVALYFGGATEWARVLFAAALSLSPLFAAFFLPIYTQARGRVFRIVKWIVMISGLLLAFGPDALKWSWLLISCLWPMIWIEGTRISLRRKLREDQWPKQLYL